jgi:hypothetical protein
MPLFHALRNCPPDARCASDVTHEKVLPGGQYFSGRRVAFHFCAMACRDTGRKRLTSEDYVKPDGLPCLYETACCAAAVSDVDQSFSRVK